MILTTAKDGLPEGPTHLAQMARNAQRIAEWRERSQGSGVAVHPERWTALLTWALGLGIGLWLLAWLWIAWEIRQVPEPETREFTNHISGESYSRAQAEWEIDYE